MATTSTADVVHGADMEWTHPGLKHRKGAPLFKYLFEGSDESLDNYNLALAQQTNFFSPRHRHNFEQFRFPIKGDFSIGSNPEVVLHEGELGYFPEGVYYGPQQDDEQLRETLILQFGGPCRQGYFSFRKLREIQKSMEDEGKFEGGKFYPNEEGVANGASSNAKDGFEALWERGRGRKLVYPEGRYQNPVMMRPSKFAWKPYGSEKGAYRKLLGVFSENEITAEMFKLEDGGGLRLRSSEEALQLLYVCSGEGQADGQPVRMQSAIRLKPGEEREVVLASASRMELLRIQLPCVDGSN